MRTINHKFIELQEPAAALLDEGPTKLPPGRKAVSVYIETTATVLIQHSTDNVNWATIATFTASGQFEIDSAIPYWRANNSAWTAGDISASVEYAPDQDA